MKYFFNYLITILFRYRLNFALFPAEEYNDVLILL